MVMSPPPTAALESKLTVLVRRGIFCEFVSALIISEAFVDPPVNKSVIKERKPAFAVAGKKEIRLKTNKKTMNHFV
jgi:hypothetical protein